MGHPHALVQGGGKQPSRRHWVKNVSTIKGSKHRHLCFENTKMDTFTAPGRFVCGEVLAILSCTFNNDLIKKKKKNFFKQTVLVRWRFMYRRSLGWIEIIIF
jgi:hypothetical protein